LKTEIPRWPFSSPGRARMATVVWFGSALAVGLVCALDLRAYDFRVYYWAARNFFIESGPMYGPNRMFGWPMVYRYPPLFLCVFRPLALLPLRAAAGVWAALQVFLLGWFLRSWYRRYPPARLAATFWIPALLLLPYLAKMLEGGNVQLLIVVLACFALLEADRRPLLAGLLLGLAAALKVWPAFLAPYLVLRRRWRAAVAEALSASVLTIAPAVWLGWKEMFRLLAEWFLQEQRINALLGDRWYPSQSLRGVMLRYLTRMNYSGLPDSNFRLVNFVSWPSVDVRYAWLALAILLGLLSMFLVWRSVDDAVAHGIFFCFLLVIEPNVAVDIYVTLLWPSLVVGALVADRAPPEGARWLCVMAALFAILIPLAPGSALQRLGQVLGVHFFLVLVPLTAGLALLRASTLSPRHAARGS
jgi:Glycosyltransferase family 87